MKAQTATFVSIGEILGTAFDDYSLDVYAEDFWCDFSELIDVSYGDASFTLVEKHIVADVLNEIIKYESSKENKDKDYIAAIDAMHTAIIEMNESLIDLEN